MLETVTGELQHYHGFLVIILLLDITWPPSSYFEISINLKGCIILEWSIIRVMIITTFKPCATTHLSV